MSKRILLLVSFLFVLMGASDPNGLALRDARRLRQEKRYDEARQAYESAIGSGLSHDVLRDALFELASCYQASKMWDQAIAFYKRFLVDLKPVPVDEPDLVRGQWSLAECFFKKGDYRPALEATLATHGKSIHSFCGTCEMEHGFRQMMREAILQEYVGNYDAAVSGYLNVAWSARAAVHLRLLNLYDTAGQLPDLLRLVQEEDRLNDEQTRPYRQGCQNAGDCPPKHSGLYQTIHGILELRGLEKARDWQALLSILEPELSGREWKHPDHELREAARLLARHPVETLPLLLPNASKRGYYAYALGLTGAPEALASLKEETKKEKNYYQLLALVDDLLAAGPEGAAALESLYPGAQENLKLLIDRYRQGTLSDYRIEPMGSLEEFPFPPIPARARLPNHCTYQGPPVNEYDCAFAREGPGPGQIENPGS